MSTRWEALICGEQLQIKGLLQLFTAVQRHRLVELLNSLLFGSLLLRTIHFVMFLIDLYKIFGC